ncbi:MAG: class I SAM-dependent methyltransferase [Planctomycetota bacterium]
MTADPAEWPLRLFRKSVLKQAKLRELTRHLGPTEGKSCLDLGSDNGVISLLLRRRGGRWRSADLAPEAVESIRALVHDDVHLLRDGRLPFPGAEFDAVAVVDMLEHLPDDRAFCGELARVCRPGGILVTNVPHARRRSPLRWFRHRLGQTEEKHGHVRPGYTLRGLSALLGDRFDLESSRTYSGFFSEAIDTLIAFAYGKIAKPGGSKGVLVTGDDLRSHRKAFRAYAAVYPVLKAFSWLDRLFFFVPGFMLIARWRRRA